MSIQSHAPKSRFSGAQLSRLCAAFGLGLLLANCGSSLLAQQNAAGGNGVTWLSIDPQYEDRSFLTSQKLAKNQVVFGKQSENASGNALANWYRKYAFPLMASQDLEGDRGKVREDLAKDLNAIKDPKLHQTLVDIAYEEATKLIEGNFDARVQYVAMLIIGNLNQTESDAATRLPAVPLPRALDYMLQKLQDPNAHDALRLAAVIGICRHAQLERQNSQNDLIPAAKEAEIVAAAETLLKQAEPSPGQSLVGLTWWRCRAANLLGAVGAVGTNLSVYNSLSGLVANEETPLSLRCSAAEAIGNLEYTDVTGIDPVVASQQLGSLAASAARAIDAQIKKELEEEKNRKALSRAGGMMGGYGGGMMSGTGMPGMGGPDGGMGYGGDPTMSGGPGMGMGYGGDPRGGGGMYGRNRSLEDEEPSEEIQRARKKLKLPLRSVLIGLQGELQPSSSSSAGSIQKLAQDDTQKTDISKIIEAVNELVDATDEYEEGLEEMMELVRTETRELETILPQPKTVEAPDAAADRPGAPSTDPAGADTPAAAPAAAGDQP
jgi:hypothetical protein